MGARTPCNMQARGCAAPIHTVTPGTQPQCILAIIGDLPLDFTIGTATAPAGVVPTLPVPQHSGSVSSETLQVSHPQTWALDR
jgi:hypothetical protein